MNSYKDLRDFFNSDEYRQSIAIGNIIKRNLPGENVAQMRRTNMDLVLRRDYNRLENSLLKQGTQAYYAVKQRATASQFDQFIIRSSYAVALRSANRAAGGGRKSEKSKSNLGKGFSGTGKISKATQKKIREIGELWSNAIFSANVEYHNKYKRHIRRKYRVQQTFITLTMPGEQRHTDQFIKRHMLNRFLIWMQRQGAKHYLWRAEAQANDMIHFHIITDTFILKQDVLEQWNCILSDYGYNDESNGTRIDGVKNGMLNRYIAKYISKGNQDQKHQDKKYQDKRSLYYAKDVGEQNYYNGYRLICGKIWGASRDLARHYREKIIQHLKINIGEHWAYVEKVLISANDKWRNTKVDEFFTAFFNKMDIFNPNNIFDVGLYYVFLLQALNNYKLLYDD